MPEEIKDLEKDAEVIKDWLSKQPHLPKSMDDQLVRRFLYSCHQSLERTKRTIDLYYTIRAQAPEIFKNRDPDSPEMENIYQITDMIPLPKTTKENYKVFIYRLADTNPDKFVFNDAVKTFLMVSDVRLINEKDFPAGEVPIFDMDGFSLRHLTRIVLPTLKKYMIYTQEAHPVRLKQIHIINATSFLDRTLALIKPFMKSEVFAMIQTHLPNSNTLEKFVPKELLPEEYGGKVGKLADLKADWIKRLRAHRDYFMDEQSWFVDENKRNGEVQKAALNMQGSFRTLSID